MFRLHPKSPLPHPSFPYPPLSHFRPPAGYHALNQLNGVVAPQELDARLSALEEARANLAQAQAQEDKADIDLTRAQVRAPVNGQVTNFSLRPGEYATAGQPVMALVDTDSFYVAGYFEETKQIGRAHV